MSTIDHSRPRLLLVDVDLDRSSYHKDMLGRDFEVLATAVTPDEALQRAEQLRPEVVLLELSVDGDRGLGLARSLTAAQPNLGVILVSDKQDLKLVREAMAVGAGDFLRRPLIREELHASVRRVVAQVRSRVRVLGRGVLPEGAGIWAFTSPCGGVGQSTAVLSVAYELVRQGHSVVVVDLDLSFGCLAFYLGLSSDSPNITGLIHKDYTDAAVVEQHLKVHATGVRALVGPGDVLAGHGVQASRVVPAVLSVERLFDFVLLDLPPGLPQGYVELLDAARFLMVPAAWNIGSMKKIREYLHVLEQLGYAPERIYPLLTGKPADESMVHEFHVLLQEAGVQPAFHLPRAQREAEEAILHSEPVPARFPTSEYAQKSAAFVHGFLGNDSRPPLPRPKTFFHRIFGSK